MPNIKVIAEHATPRPRRPIARQKQTDSEHQECSPGSGPLREKGEAYGGAGTGPCSHAWLSTSSTLTHLGSLRRDS